MGLGINYFVYTCVLLSTTSALLGIFAYFYAPKSDLKNNLVFFCASVCAWSVGWIFWLQAKNIEDAMLYQRLFSLAALAIVITTFNFVTTLTQTRIPKWVKVTNWIAIAVFAVLGSFTNLIVSTLEPLGPIPFYPRSGPLLPLLIAWTGALITPSFYFLYKTVQSKTTAQHKQQCKWVLVGLFISWLTGLTAYIGFYGIAFPPWAHILCVIYPFTFTYALVKHKMLDVEVVLRKTVVFSGLFAATAFFISFVNFTLPKVFSALGFTGNPYWTNVATFFASFYLLRRVREKLVQWTDRYLFQKPVDYPTLMTNIAKDGFRMNNSQRLVELLVGEIKNGLRLKGSAIYLKNDKKGIYEPKAKLGNINDSEGEAINSDLISFLDSSQHGFGLNLHPPSKRVPESCAKKLKSMNAEVCIPLMNFHDLQGFILLGEKQSDEVFDSDDFDQLVPLGKMISVSVSNTMLNEELDIAKKHVEAARFDGLTGALIRAAFEEKHEMESLRARHFGGKYSILMIDLDHFKKKNDTYGHQAGDAILKESAARIAACLRGSDFLGRYGGEEFIAFLQGADRSVAKVVAERIRKALADSPIDYDGQKITQTASLGIAVFPDHGTGLPQLTKIADECLYSAKNAGRNCVISPEESSDESKPLAS